MKSFIGGILTLLIVTTSTAQFMGIGPTEKSFTENKRMQYEDQGYSFSGIQFYTSSEIYLKRELPKETISNETTQKGTIAYENGKKYIYYKLKEGSFCVFESISSNKEVMTLRFGQDQDETIQFKLKPGVGTDQNKYYVINAPDKQLSFLGYKWELLSWDGCRLEVKEKGKSKVKVQKTKSKGMKIDGTEKGGSILNKVKGN